MNKPKLTVAMFAATAIKSRHIINFKAGDDSQVELSTAKTKEMWGVSSDLDVIAGDPIDVVCSGSAGVTYGDTVTAGELLTADSQGRAIPATSGSRVIGVAMENGAVTDIGSVLIGSSKI